MKNVDIILCLNAHEGFVKDKTYNILSITEFYIVVKDDNNNKWFFEKRKSFYQYFKVLTDIEIRKYKLKKLKYA